MGKRKPAETESDKQPIPKKARTEVNTSDTSEIHPHSQGVQENNPDLGILPSTSAPHSHSIATNIHVFDLDKAFQTPGRDTVKLTFPDTEKVLHVPIDFFNTCFNQIFRQVTPGDKPIPIKHQYEPFLDMLNFLHPLKRKPLNTLDDKIIAEIFDIANEYQIQTAIDASKVLLLVQLEKLIADSYTVFASSQILLNKALHIVRLAEKWDDNDIMERFIDRICTVPYLTVVNSNKYKNLKNETQSRILLSLLKRTDAENNVYLCGLILAVWIIYLNLYGFLLLWMYYNTGLF